MVVWIAISLVVLFLYSVILTKLNLQQNNFTAKTITVCCCCLVLRETSYHIIIIMNSSSMPCDIYWHHVFSLQISLFDNVFCPSCMMVGESLKVDICHVEDQFNRLHHFSKSVLVSLSNTIIIIIVGDDVAVVYNYVAEHMDFTWDISEDVELLPSLTGWTVLLLDYFSSRELWNIWRFNSNS